MAKRRYRVKKGDDFFKISKKLYGDASYAMALIRANPGFDYVGPGMVLRLPKEEPRVTRQRKLKRREKLYGKPEPPDEQTTTNDQFDWSEYEDVLEMMEDPSEALGYDPGAALGQEEATTDPWDDPAFEDEMAELFAETALKMGFDLDAIMEELGFSEATPPAQEKKKVGPGHIMPKITLPQWPPPPPQPVDEEGDLPEPDQSGMRYPKPEKTPTPLTDEQLAELKVTFAEMGMDESATLNELGLSERDPAAADRIQEPAAEQPQISDPVELSDYLTEYISELKIKENDKTYRVEILPLDQLSEAGVQVISNYLGIGENPQGFSFDEAIQQISLLQQYWGLDNQEMITNLREIFYPDLLDPFILNAEKVERDVLAISGYQNNISEEDAALAFTLLQLSVAPGGFQDEDNPELGYNDPIIPILIEGADQGFDHVIAGLDGYFNPIGDFVDDNLKAWILALGFNVWEEEVDSVPAVTYLGDLGAVVQRSLQGKVFDHGYDIEVPKQDFDGDIMATAIINSGLLGNQDLTLGEVFEIAYDPEGEIYPNRFKVFADAIGLQVDPKTGDILNAEKFVEDNFEIVNVFGVGLYLQDGKYDLNTLALKALAEDYTKMALDQFIFDIQRKLWLDAGSISEGPND